MTLMDDILNGVNQLFYGGDPSGMEMSKMILSTFVILSTVIPMAYLKIKPMPMIVLIIILMVMLVAIGWLSGQVLLVIGLITAAFWGTKIADWYSSKVG